MANNRTNGRTKLGSVSLFLIVVLLFFSVSTLSTSARVNDAQPKNAPSDQRLYVGGIPFGVKFMTDGVLIVSFHPIEGCPTEKHPAKAAGLHQGDRILKINDKPLSSAVELSELVSKSGGAPLRLICERNGKEFSSTLTPIYVKSEGRYVSGISVRDSGAGIGTVTFIDPTSGAFAGLGHGICDGATGALIPMQRGSVVNVKISGIVRGLAGAPGEVKGYFSSGKVGTLLGNTECGVYGVLAKLPKECGEPMTVGRREELQEGSACIYCTLDDNVRREYSVEISNIQRNAMGNKCFTVKITDEALLAKTGGIIQGMSGSPIIQNGKLVGAVTHVLINDPTTGYGIFIENMLASVNIPMAKAS